MLWLESEHCCIHWDDILRKARRSCGVCFLPRFSPTVCSTLSPRAVLGEGDRALLKRNAWRTSTSSRDSSVHPLIGPSVHLPVHWSIHPSIHSPTLPSTHPASRWPCPRHTYRYWRVLELERAVRHRPHSQGFIRAYSLIRET